MIKAIIFDMGGVILMNKAEELFKNVSKHLGVDYNSFEELRGQYYKDMLKGNMSCKEFADIVKHTFKLNVDVLEKWREVYLEVMNVNKELLELADELKKNYKVAIISNMPNMHAEINKERNVFSHFKPAFISCEIGLIKPQKEIFDLMLEKLKLKAEECIFIDDRENHLDVPKEMGFKVIHYTGNNNLMEQLKQLEILF
ncbi:MAG: HAD family phosphatase [Nanoarchaeota archaeon]|nr:HAD family phosphatase [DPANN group archaeon]MBL7116743.1 HAD family phosphatase [Nanoarchaeota archaeon]